MLLTIEERDAYLWRQDRARLIEIAKRHDELSTTADFEPQSKRDLIEGILRAEFGNEETDGWFES